MKRKLVLGLLVLILTILIADSVYAPACQESFLARLLGALGIANTPCTQPQETTCGNGIINGLEQCDTGANSGTPVIFAAKYANGCRSLPGKGFGELGCRSNCTLNALNCLSVFSGKKIAAKNYARALSSAQKVNTNNCLSGDITCIENMLAQGSTTDPRRYSCSIVNEDGQNYLVCTTYTTQVIDNIIHGTSFVCRTLLSDSPEGIVTECNPITSTIRSLYGTLLSPPVTSRTTKRLMSEGMN